MSEEWWEQGETAPTFRCSAWLSFFWHDSSLSCTSADLFFSSAKPSNLFLSEAIHPFEISSTSPTLLRLCFVAKRWLPSLQYLSWNSCHVNSHQLFWKSRRRFCLVTGHVIKRDGEAKQVWLTSIHHQRRLLMQLCVCVVARAPWQACERKLLCELFIGGGKTRRRARRGSEALHCWLYTPAYQMADQQMNTHLLCVSGLSLLMVTTF